MLGKFIFHKFVGTDIWAFLAVIMRLFLIVFILISKLFRFDRN